MSAAAAVDVGSNSVRLLVVDADGVNVDRHMRITRLAAGVDRTGQLDDAAIARTVEAIGEFAARWRSLGVRDRVRITSTSAVRDAGDRHRFLDAVESAVGVRPEVLSGHQEAALAFAGATGAVDVAMPTAVLDIGGGSTEIVLGDRDGVQDAVSLQLGCVRLTERCLHTDPPSAIERDQARTVIAEQLDEADRVLGPNAVAGRSLVAVAGTATTLAALHLGLPTYEEDRIHGTRIPAEPLAALTNKLVGLTAAERAKLGPMQAGREDVIHGGALVLDAVMARYGFDGVIISEADGLDGSAASLVAQ